MNALLKSPVAIAILVLIGVAMAIVIVPRIMRHLRRRRIAKERMEKRLDPASPRATPGRVRDEE